MMVGTSNIPNKELVMNLKAIRRLISALLSAILVLGLTACGRQEIATEATTEREVVKIPIIFTVDPTSGKKNNQELAEAFNKQYEGIYELEVEWILETEEEYRKNLRRLNATGELPAIIYDVCTVPSFYKMMVEEGRLEDLTQYIQADEEWSKLIEPSVMEGCTYSDGRIYLGPISTAAFTCSGMFWNEKMFARAGIDKFPETWEEFWQVCDKLQEKGYTPLALHSEGTGWAPMLISTAALAEDQSGYDFMRQMLPESYSNECGERLGNIIQRLFQYTTKDALHNDYDVAYTNFFNGRAAMIPNGYWMIDQIPENWKDKVRFSSFPDNTMVASPETFGWAVVSSYDEEVKKAAVAFLRFRTEYNKAEKDALFLGDDTEKSRLLLDYQAAYESMEKVIPNYQTKWNSIFQETTLGEAIPLLAEGSITVQEFTAMADRSVAEYKEEQ